MPGFISKADCEKRHEKLDEDIEKALTATAKTVAAHLKIWILGSVLGIVLAAALTVFYGIVEIGQYKERIDTTASQLNEMKQISNQQFEELKREVRDLRNILMKGGNRE